MAVNLIPSINGSLHRLSVLHSAMMTGSILASECPEMEASVLLSGHSVATFAMPGSFDDGGGEDAWALGRLLSYSSNFSEDHLNLNG